jgi:hypothetical protein
MSAIGSDTLIALSYQLDLVTPGIMPSLASLRKHNLHMSNFLMYPLGRPQSLQRRTSRVVYFGFFRAFRIIANLAILTPPIS